MAYDERSFLQGLAAGLSVTSGRRLAPLNRNYLQGTTYASDYPSWEVWQRTFDTFAFRLWLIPKRACTIEYEYGPVGTEFQHEFIRVQASTELKTFYHVVRLPEAIPMAQFRYDLYLHEIRERVSANFIPFDARFAAFPLFVKWHGTYAYPGSPEQWNWNYRISRTIRRMPI